MQIKKFLRLNIFALIFNFVGALMMALSTGGELQGGRGGGLGVFDSGLPYVYLNHPIMFKIGLYLIVIGFCIQLVSEIVKRKKNMKSGVCKTVGTSIKF